MFVKMRLITVYVRNILSLQPCLPWLVLSSLNVLLVLLLRSTLLLVPIHIWATNPLDVWFLTPIRTSHLIFNRYTLFEKVVHALLSIFLYYVFTLFVESRVSSYVLLLIIPSMVQPARIVINEWISRSPRSGFCGIYTCTAVLLSSRERIPFTSSTPERIDCFHATRVVRSRRYRSFSDSWSVRFQNGTWSGI